MASPVSEDVGAAVVVVVGAGGGGGAVVVVVGGGSGAVVVVVGAGAAVVVVVGGVVVFGAAAAPAPGTWNRTRSQRGRPSWCSCDRQRDGSTRARGRDAAVDPRADPACNRHQRHAQQQATKTAANSARLPRSSFRAPPFSADMTTASEAAGRGKKFENLDTRLRGCKRRNGSTQGRRHKIAGHTGISARQKSILPGHCPVIGRWM